MKQQQVDTTVLMEVLNEIVEKLGYGILKSITVQTADFSSLEIKR